jgi:serralysin
MAYNVTGTAGTDTLNQSGDTGPGTIIALAGDDSILIGTGLVSVTGDSGNDSILLQNGNIGTVNGGSENDIIQDRGTASLANPIDANGFAFIGPMLTLGGTGADTIVLINSETDQTIVGGSDSSDGADNLTTGGGNNWVFGNGGNDIIDGFGVASSAASE